MIIAHLPLRRGATLTELVVAGTLLVTALGMFARGTVSCKKLSQDTRHFQLAVDELANQLDRLLALAPRERESALVDLQPSTAIRSTLPGASLKADIVDDEEGQRLVLSLQWDRPGPASAVSLVGWLRPPAASSVESSGDRS